MIATPIAAEHSRGSVPSSRTRAGRLETRLNPGDRTLPVFASYFSIHTSSCRPRRPQRAWKIARSTMYPSMLAESSFPRCATSIFRRGLPRTVSVTRVLALRRASACSANWSVMTCRFGLPPLVFRVATDLARKSFCYRAGLFRDTGHFAAVWPSGGSRSAQAKLPG